MIADLGRFGLLAALLVAGYGAAQAAAAGATRDARRADSAVRAAAALLALVAGAAALLAVALARGDFSLAYVADVSSRDLPPGYRLAALWGGQAGSLLLWTLWLAAYTAAALGSLRRRAPHLLPAAAATLFVVAVFFLILITVPADPFARLPLPLDDGRGLNPLLRNPWMAVHPPALYAGFVGLAVPFALAVAALVHGRPGPLWASLSRRWMMIAWYGLTLGLLLGAKWSYVVLGWGGYWAWDAVENAALLPWLVATAYLHSSMVFEQRGMLRRWTVGLVLLAFALAVLGTFLTRTGLLSSVHAFARSAIGPPFLALLAAVAVGSIALLAWRWDALGGGEPLDSALSREAAFLANNVLFVAAAAVVALGTFFPLLAEAVTGRQVGVGPPYFNRVVAPIALALAALMGAGPLLAWRRTSPRALARLLAWPAASAAAAALALAAAGITRAGVVAAGAAAAFVAAGVFSEYARGARARSATGWPGALVSLVAANHRRYGGYVVHLGIAIMLVGIAASQAYATTREATLRPGESVPVGPYALRYVGLTQRREPGLVVTEAVLDVRAGARDLGPVRPRHLFHLSRGQATSDAGVRTGLVDDLYTVLVAWEADRRVTIRALVNPLVSWIWVGGLVITLGVALALLPDRRRAAVPEAASGLRPAVGSEA